MIYRGSLMIRSALLILVLAFFSFSGHVLAHEGTHKIDRAALAARIQEALKQAGISPLLAPQRVEKGDVSVNFTLVPLSKEAKGGVLLEGSEVRLLFQVKERSSGKPLEGVDFLSWMDIRKWPGSSKEAQQARRILKSRCARCHTDARIRQKRLDEGAWHLIIDTMRGNGAIINNEEQKTLARYLATNYGPQKETEDLACRRKIAGFAGGQLSQKPTIDLNGYYLLALQDDNSISLIDPLTRVGSTSLLRTVKLRSPGADFVLSGDQSYLYVTMPRVNAVAVIDTLKMKVLRELSVGTRPTRLATQPDGKYVWVSSEGSGYTYIIDTKTNRIKKALELGPGAHRFAFDDKSKFAYIVSSSNPGRFNMIRISDMTRIRQLKLGKKPAGLAYSPISKAIYIADEELGVVHVYERKKGRFSKPIKLSPGVSSVRFEPDGRWGFVPNTEKGTVTILDASGKFQPRTMDSGRRPDQVSFTDDYAYIRNLGSRWITLIKLDSLGRSERIDSAKVNIYQSPPEAAKGVLLANAIDAEPHGMGVMVASPAERTIYYYMEGMNAPMGGVRGMIRSARGVLVLDKSLQEAIPGTHTTSVKIRKAGVYDVPFLIRDIRGEARVYGCFRLEVRSKRGELRAQPFKFPISVERVSVKTTFRPGEAALLRFRVTDPELGQALENLPDVRIMAFRMPGNWRWIERAHFVGNGVYQARFVFPTEGSYYILVESRSKGVKFGDIRHVVISVREGAGSFSP